mgnify:CR=1 FL=1
MKKLVLKRSTTLLIYAIISLSISLLSLLFLIAKIWEVSAILFISSIMNFIYLVLILYWGVDKNSKTSIEKPISVFVFSLLRILCELISILSSALIIYFVPSSIEFAGDSRLRFLYVLLALIPHAIALFLCMMHSKVEE